ncbi:MAG TPA: hypothetical protein VHL79_17470 [Ramlibacter sp.]|jgi:hypothetical protein|nr:hypothetical protein [Ramlibacter sp.]
MPQDPRELAEPESFLDGPALWLSGGAALLVWTALSVLLTSA